MNEARVYADDFSRSFVNERDFFGFLRQVMGNSRWDTKQSKDLRVYALEEGSRVTEQLKENHANASIDSGVIDDTAVNTGLLLKTGSDIYPIRQSAIKTILDRAGISGPALRKLDKSVYAKIINECLKIANGNALLRISENKVSAVLGGDKCDYTILDMEQIFYKTVEYLTSNFKDCTYLGGFYEHTMASSIWELSSEDKMLEAYEKELCMYGKKDEEIKPVVRVSTSDVGLCGANVYPMLLCGSGMIPLGSPLKLYHKSGATLDKFKEQLRMIYGKYQQALGMLSRLLSIDISNPLSCMLGVMKKVGVSKKYAFEALELFKAQFGEDPCTAHDIYYGMAEVIYMFTVNGESGSRTTLMEENIARALSVNWKEYDIPGELKW